VGALGALVNRKIVFGCTRGVGLYGTSPFCGWSRLALRYRIIDGIDRARALSQHEDEYTQERQEIERDSDVVSCSLKLSTTPSEWWVPECWA
jgi:hypothetical protein